MFTRIALPVAAIFIILYIAVSILTTGGNALSEAMLYLALFGLLTGILNARLGMMFVFFCGNYLDFFKRFLVVSGSILFSDVIKTLAVAPIAMVGVFAGILVNYSKGNTGKLPVYRLILALAISAAVIAANLLSRETFGTVLQNAANSALYVGLLALAGSIFPTMEAQQKMMRTLALLFVPVIIYGWMQLEYGYNRVEIRYALSGLTVVHTPLMNPGEVEYKRVFSMMNSNVAYTHVGVVLSVYAMIFGFGSSLMGRFMGFSFALVCLGSHVPGAGRTGWVIALVAFGGYFVFKNRIATVFTYVLSVSMIALFLFNADYVGKKLVDLTAGKGSTDFQMRAMTMGTFTERTKGIAEVFSNGRYFSLFGLSREEAMAAKSHDMLGQIYVKTGAVGLTLSVSAGMAILYVLHSRLLRIRDPNRKRLASFYISCVFAEIIGGVFSGSQLNVFPLNVYFWICLGLLFQLLETEAVERRVEKELRFRPSPEADVQEHAPGPLALVR